MFGDPAGALVNGYFQRLFEQAQRITFYSNIGHAQAPAQTTPSAHRQAARTDCVRLWALNKSRKNQ